MDSGVPSVSAWSFIEAALCCTRARGRPFTFQQRFSSESLRRTDRGVAGFASRKRVKSTIQTAVSIPSKRGSARLRPKTEQRYQLGMSKPDFQPTLIGPTVLIRPVVAEDWPELFDAGSDPQIWKVHPSPDRYTEPAFRKFFDGAVASKMGFVFVDRSTNRLIGSSRYHGYDAERGEIEIGWTFIVREHWGGTTNREVKRLMLDHAFTFVDTVIFWVGERNWRSQGAMTKIGGVRRSGLFTREATGATPYFIFEIGKEGYEQGGRDLVE
jgi:RimJ/RimL family protein N-acetyltransferase